MKEKNIKVFHGLVNYGTQAGFFARELRNQGVEAYSLVYPDKFKRQTDHELLFGGNFFLKILKHSLNYIKRIICFFYYNTFHFYYGTTLFPYQLDLPLYKLFRKKVIMEYLGTDCQLYGYSIQKYKWTNSSGRFSTKEQGLNNDNIILKRLKNELPYIVKKYVCAPLYSEFVKDSTVLPLAIDISEFNFNPLIKKEKIRVMHAPTHRGFKGSDYILEALNKLIEEGYPLEIDLVEGVTHEQLKNRYLQCDIFIDQILAGWYGTASIEAMAMGRPVICFIRDNYFKEIDYGPNIPIISADPDSIYEVLKNTIGFSFEKLQEIGVSSRLFVEEIHDVKKVAKKLIKEYRILWNNHL